MREGIAEMWRLVSVEFRRFFARDVVRLFGLLLLVAIVLGGLGAFVSASSPPNPEEIDEMIARIRSNFDERVERCMEPRDPSELPPDMSPEFREQLLRQLSERECVMQVNSIGVGNDTRFDLGSAMPFILMILMGPFTAIAFVTGATFIGAEWGAGTMTNLFTYEPRRHRVVATKGLAVIVASVAFFVLVVGSVFLALLPTALGDRGTMARVDVHFFSVVWDLGWRGMALAALGGLLGMGLTNLVRRTAAAIGFAFGWLFVIEGFLGSFTEALTKWMLTRNLTVAVGGVRENLIPGRSAEEALGLLALYAVALYSIGAFLFWRRDVASE